MVNNQVGHWRNQGEAFAGLGPHAGCRQAMPRDPCSCWAVSDSDNPYEQYVLLRFDTLFVNVSDPLLLHVFLKFELVGKFRFRESELAF